MYISVDMENMNLICKHPNFAYCYNYSLICKGDDFNVFDPENKNCWKQFTDMEIQLFYIHLTGNSNGCVRADEHIYNILIQYIMQMDETTIDKTVYDQAQWCVDSQVCGQYMFVPRTSLPLIKERFLWPTVSFTEQLEASCHKKVDSSEWKKQVGAEWQAERGDGGSVSTRSSAPRQRKTAEGNAGVQGSERPTRNGACARIWEVADSEAAKDEYKSILETKDFKKHVRNLLIAEGINPSTVSVQLSKWQKEKLG